MSGLLVKLLAHNEARVEKMNFFKKIDRAIVNRIDDAQEAAAILARKEQ